MSVGISDCRPCRARNYSRKYAKGNTTYQITRKELGPDTNKSEIMAICYCNRALLLALRPQITRPSCHGYRTIFTSDRVFLTADLLAVIGQSRWYEEKCLFVGAALEDCGMIECHRSLQHVLRQHALGGTFEPLVQLQFAISVPLKYISHLLMCYYSLTKSWQCGTSWKQIFL